MRFSIVGAAIVAMLSGPASAWDSANGNPTHPTHSYLTEAGIKAASGKYAEIGKYAQQIVEGANTELHELKLKLKGAAATPYGIDLEAKGVEHKGTNEGTADIAGWWAESLKAYKAGSKEQAYFYLGVVLHMIEDMGVPAHAHLLYHQGLSKDFDNFEVMGVSNWRPDYADKPNKSDPKLKTPAAYYAFSQKWTLEDSPNYISISSFSKTWSFASEEERKLIANRQLRTSLLAGWALLSAGKAFGL
jgi:hypothetical protein